MPQSGSDCASGKALEGADRQTDRHTDKLFAHYSKIIVWLQVIESA